MSGEVLTYDRLRLPGLLHPPPVLAMHFPTSLFTRDRPWAIREQYNPASDLKEGQEWEAEMSASIPVQVELLGLRFAVEVFEEVGVDLLQIDQPRTPLRFGWSGTGTRDRLPNHQRRAWPHSGNLAFR
jgi:hypothetical protein